jgi:hypothetical protein
MATPPPSLEKVTKEPSSALPIQATPCASTGTYQGRATPARISQGTAAPAAVATTTEPKHADLHSPKFRIRTPYHATEWQTLLEANSLPNKYRHIPISLQYGFNAAVKYIAHMFTPSNNESISVHNDIFQQSIAHEFSKGRYEGPFTQQQVEDILSPFQTSPLSIVPKPNKPGKY